MYVQTPSPEHALTVAQNLAAELADLAEKRNDQYAYTRALRILAALRLAERGLR